MADIKPTQEVQENYQGTETPADHPGAAEDPAERDALPEIKADPATVRMAKLLSKMESKQERQITNWLLEHLGDQTTEAEYLKREKLFWTSSEHVIISIVYHYDKEKLTPGSADVKNFISLLDGIKKVTFPELRENAPEGATFAEAAGLDPEYIKTRRVLIVQEMLWNDLYPPTKPTEPAEDPAEISPAGPADPDSEPDAIPAEDPEKPDTAAADAPAENPEKPTQAAAGPADPGGAEDPADDLESFFDEPLDDYPLLESTGTPARYTAPNTTLTNSMQNLDGKGEVIGAGPLDLPVIGRAPSEITIFVNAAITDNQEIKGHPYTEYDRAVEAAIWSIYIDRTRNKRPPIATAEMIYRTMTHKTETESVSIQQAESVKRTIAKLTKIYLEVDATDEMRKRRAAGANGKPIDEFKIRGYMLYVKEIKVRSGNDIIYAYLFWEPLLMTYARITKQMISVKGEILAIKKLNSKGRPTTNPIANTENRIAAKFYLMRRIAVMENDEKRAAVSFAKYKETRAKNEDLPEKSLEDYRRQSRAVSFETLFRAAGVTTKNSKTNMREYVYNVLDYWQAIGKIKGYRKTKKRGRKTADTVEIELQ